MDTLINILLIAIATIIFVQDFKTKSLSLGIIISFYLTAAIWFSLNLNSMQNIIANSLIIGIIAIIVYGYFVIFRKINPINRHIGLGDIILLPAFVFFLTLHIF
jgi:hypothetical protein